MATEAGRRHRVGRFIWTAQHPRAMGDSIVQNWCCDHCSVRIHTITSNGRESWWIGGQLYRSFLGAAQGAMDRHDAAMKAARELIDNYGEEPVR